MSNGQVVGTVGELWQFPVKSMQGERRERVELAPGGMVGDRVAALVSDRGHLLSAKTVPDLLWASARTEPDGEVVVTLPDGTELSIDDPAAAETFSAWLGRPVTVLRTGALPATALTYEMTFDPPDDTAELFALDVPEGRLHDLADLHLLTRASLAAMAARAPESDWDLRRFRPGVFLDVEGDTFAEDAWAGATLAFGDGGARISVLQQAVRCAMPLRAQPGGLERDVALYRALSDAHNFHLGSYCSVLEPGQLRVGDLVVLSR